MGIPWRQETALRPSSPRPVPKFQTGHGEEPARTSDLSAARALPCTSRRHASPGFGPPAEHLDRAQETAFAEHFGCAPEAKTWMLQVQLLGSRSGSTCRKSFASYKSQLWIHTKHRLNTHDRSGRGAAQSTRVTTCRWRA